MRTLFAALLSLMLVGTFAAGCGDQTDLGEDYGDILTGPSGLILTEAEHQQGWGRSDCTACHNLNNIHLTDRSGSGIDVATIQDETFSDGEAGCPTCHGTNGVP